MSRSRIALPRFRANRVLFQLALLVALALTDLYSDGLFLVATAAILTVAPTALWTVAVVLKWASRQAPDIESLREKADDAVTLALAATGFAIAGAVVFVRLANIQVPGRPVVVLIGWGALLVLVPGLTWLRTWRGIWLPYVTNKEESAHDRSDPGSGEPHQR